ncbi:MAG: rRNA maturation RNase YbeY [Thermoanaerobaculia bacterium]
MTRAARRAAPSPAPAVAWLGAARFPEARSPRLAAWTRRLVAALAPGFASFAVRFVGERAMRVVNRDFRGQDRPTDVLSFPGGESPEGRHLGDVAISVPTARRQAAALGHSTDRELRLLVLHGLLHCLGHDHETDGGEMERLERRLRRRWLADE